MVLAAGGLKIDRWNDMLERSIVGVPPGLVLEPLLFFDIYGYYKCEVGGVGFVCR